MVLELIAEVGPDWGPTAAGLLGNGAIAAAMLYWLTRSLVPSMQSDLKAAHEGRAGAEVAFAAELRAEREARDSHREAIVELTGSMRAIGDGMRELRDDVRAHRERVDRAVEQHLLREAT